MPRRETETKAKAFAYAMDQLAWIGDDLLVDANDGKVPGGFRPAKLAYWSWFFPEIGTDAAKRSRFQANKTPAELLKMIERPGGYLLSGAKEVKLSQDALASFDLACIVGWLVRNEDGPFSELFSTGRHFSERMGREQLGKFLALLAEDFAGAQPYLLDGLQDALSAILLAIARAPEGRVCSWEFGFDHYGSYLVRKHRAGGRKEDWRADLVTLLIMAALLGPKDYRADLLIDAPEKFERTADSASSRDNLSVTSVKTQRKCEIACRVFLTRVTFDREPPNELDWVMCEEDVETSNGNMGRILAVPLEGKRKVIMARALPRFNNAGDVIEIPLNCREASSKAHVLFELTLAGWTVRDLRSTNGTLVVSRDGTRRMLYRKEPDGEQDVLLRDGDVICVAPNHSTGKAVATNPAFLFHRVTTTWY